ncbi:uncharacterized protein LOC118422696 [Branchiostoma floridae]|uniref:Uncharacterized protein LOC118422696 n=1 Tax=Branchiostoma floridae TaxID=7739 RepID=C3XZF0_BRAFL|nr:uncharacterized protein LOC118422696 [Branchiostoma floridae]|eukprot:XP_002610704.1 hypothetical protein BRAFLDRAFT_117947 [Branchiostoma floridae]
MMLLLALVLSVATALPARRQTQDIFNNLDINSDGAVTLHEAEHQLTVGSIFTALDADCDGVVTMDQVNFYMPDMVAVLSPLDLDGNQSLTSQEAQTATTIGNIFNFFDVNDDGLLERPEAARLIELITRLQAAAAAQGNTGCQPLTG